VQRPKKLLKISNQPIDKPGKRVYNAVNPPSKWVNVILRGGLLMSLIWDTLLHANFRCGRMCKARAELLAESCTMPFFGRM